MRRSEPPSELLQDPWWAATTRLTELAPELDAMREFLRPLGERLTWAGCAGTERIAPASALLKDEAANPPP